MREGKYVVYEVEVIETRVSVVDGVLGGWVYVCEVEEIDMIAVTPETAEALQALAKQSAETGWACGQMEVEVEFCEGIVDGVKLL